MLKTGIAIFALYALSGIVNPLAWASSAELDAISQAAQKYVRAAYPGKSLTFEAAKLNWYSNGKVTALSGKGEIQPGGYNARYTVNGGPLQIKKLQMEKNGGEWKVHRELMPAQIHAAHPLAKPFLDKPRYSLKAVAAQYFEKNMYSQLGGWKKIKEPNFITCNGGESLDKMAYCEVPYGVYYKGDYMINGSYLHAKCSAVTYIFGNVNGKWVVKNTLPAEKTIDRKSDKIIQRRGSIFGC